MLMRMSTVSDAHSTYYYLSALTKLMNASRKLENKMKSPMSLFYCILNLSKF